MKVSKNEENTLNIIKQAYPSMSEFDKGYILGIVENIARNREKKNAEAGTAAVQAG